jgi:hypothetical protein
VFTCTLLLGCCTFAGRHVVVRMFTEDASIRAATVLVVPAVATSIVGEWHDRRNHWYRMCVLAFNGCVFFRGAWLGMW